MQRVCYARYVVRVRKSFLVSQPEETVDSFFITCLKAQDLLPNHRLRTVVSIDAEGQTSLVIVAEPEVPYQDREK